MKSPIESIEACMQKSLCAADVCSRIVDLRGQIEYPNMSEDELNNVEVVLMSSFTSAGHDRTTRQWQWAKDKSKAVVLVHGDESWGMEGLESHSMGALWISSDWEPLLHRLGSQGMLHSVETADSEAVYRQLEALSTEVIVVPSVRPQFKKQAIVSQLYGAYTKQGSGVTARSWRHHELLKLVHRMARNAALGEYTSVMVTRIPEGSPLMVHRDRANLPGTKTWITSFGPFAGRGGRLWTFSVEGKHEPPVDRVTYHRWVALDGQTWHAVEPGRGGDRFSVSLFTAGNLQLLTGEHWQQLVSLGFPIRRLRNMYGSNKLSALIAEVMVLETMADRMQRGNHEAGEHVDEPEWVVSPAECEGATDTSSGKVLAPALVAEARREEMSFLHGLGAYRVVPHEGQKLLPIGWVTVNKGDDQHPKIRARLVVKETRYHSDLEEGAGNATTPPYEALKFMLSIAMSQKGVSASKGNSLQFMDITRAHPHCRVEREVYIRLPDEDPASRDGKHCGLLLRCLYGLRDASRAFEKYVAETMTTMGFQCGVCGVHVCSCMLRKICWHMCMVTTL
eukprot:2059882-Amphidinium_carterae.3